MKPTKVEEPDYFILRNEFGEHKMFFYKRDWLLLNGESRLLPEGREFIKCTKAIEGYSVAKGPSSQLVYEICYAELIGILARLKKNINNRMSLLLFDYTLELRSRSKNKLTSIGGFSYMGYRASAWAKYKGYCVLDLYENGDVGPMRPVGFIDISSKESIDTDEDGPLRIYRSEKPSILLETIESGFAFLQTYRTQKIEIEFLK